MASRVHLQNFTAKVNSSSSNHTKIKCLLMSIPEGHQIKFQIDIKRNENERKKKRAKEIE